MNAQNMPCEQAERWIHKHVDQELSVKQVGELRQHLEACAPCRALHGELQASKAWFVAEEAPAVPAGFAARVTALAFAGQAGSAETEAPVLAHLSGGAARGVVLGGSDRFLKRATAVAAGFLAVLGLALYSQNAVSERSLVAEDGSLETVLEEMDQLNRAGQQPDSEVPAETPKPKESQR